MATIEQIKKLKILLGITDTEKEEYVRFALETAEQTILDFCHIEELPQQLNITMYRMAMDIYRNEQFGTSEEIKRISSVTVGDTSTSFSGMEDEYAKSLLKDYLPTLKKYRKVVFK